MLVVRMCSDRLYPAIDRYYQHLTPTMKLLTKRVYLTSTVVQLVKEHSTDTSMNWLPLHWETLMQIYSDTPGPWGLSLTRTGLHSPCFTTDWIPLRDRSRDAGRRYHSSFGWAWWRKEFETALKGGIILRKDRSWLLCRLGGIPFVRWLQ